MNCRCVWFDLGMTLVRTPVEELYRQVLAAFGLRREQEEIRRAFYLADKTFMKNYPHVLETSPANYLPWYLGVVNYHLAVSADLNETCRIYQEAGKNLCRRWCLVPGAAELLRELRRRGVRTGLISNWDLSCRRVLRENGLDRLLEHVIVSSEVGAEKPDPDIFKAALHAAGVSPDQALFVGDNYYDDVVGAQKSGIRCLLLAPYGNLGMEEIRYRPSIAQIGEVLNYLA